MLVLLVPFEAYAIAVENNLTSGVLSNYKNVMLGVLDTISTITAATFWALATLELVYSLGLKALGGSDIGGIIRSFIKRLLFIGFWGWMLTNAKQNIDYLIDTMVNIASRGVKPITWNPSLGTKPLVANDRATIMNPDNIIDQGIQLVKDTVENLPSGVSELPIAIAQLVAVCGVFIALMVIAAYMALAMLEMYIVGYGAVFLLALGPNRHTTGYAQAYIRYVFSLSLKIFAIALIAAIAQVVMRQQIALMAQDNSGQVWATLAMAAILAILATKAPASIQGAITGMSNSAAPATAAEFIKQATAAAASAVGMSAAVGATAAAGGHSGMASASAARAQGVGSAMSVAKGIGGGFAGAASAVGGAAVDSVKEGIGGRSGSSPFPRGGTAGGRAATRIAQNSKR